MTRGTQEFRRVLSRVVPIVLSLAIGAAAQGSGDLWKRVQEAFDSGDRFAIPSLIADPAGDTETVSRYFETERSLYWEGRNLPAAVFVAEQGIAYCLTRAGIESENETLARQFRSAAGRIAFNLASATWPGWDEEGIDITEEQRRVGAAGARLALAVSEELDAGPAARANGHWMVGAHLLASGNLDDAIRSFDRAALFARAARDRGMELTSEGFAALAEIVGDPDDAGASRRLREIRDSLEREVEDPAFWASQIDSAYRVFVTH